MKKNILSPLFAFLVFCTSCDIHFSENGELDGFWQLARVDTLQGGSADVTNLRLFWSVQSELLQVSDLNYQHDAYIFRFEHKGDALRLYEPYLVDHAGSDIAVTQVDALQPYGLQSLDETFQVENLDKNNLQLKSHTLRLSFNRY